MSARTGAEPGEREAPGPLARARRFAREHPYMLGLLVAFTVAGAVFGAVVPIGELSLARRVVGGAVCGFYFGLFPLGFRLFD